MSTVWLIRLFILLDAIRTFFLNAKKLKKLPLGFRFILEGI